jgi:tRNA(adenine34) deaminase
MRLTKAEKERLVRAAITEARRGMADGEAPIGCVIALPMKTQPGRARIVARGYNRTNALQRSVAHAEMIAFENASISQSAADSNGAKRTKRIPLPPDAEEIILVSSLEPCVMCLSAAMEAGVTHVLYALKAPADAGKPRVTPPKSPEAENPMVEGGILARESRRLFEKWLEANAETEQADYVRQLLSETAKIQ